MERLTVEATLKKRKLKKRFNILGSVLYKKTNLSNITLKVILIDARHTGTHVG